MKLTKDESPELITIDEMCDILSIGKGAAYNLLKNKEVKSFKIGRIWKIPRQSINEYIATYGYTAI